MIRVALLALFLVLAGCGGKQPVPPSAGPALWAVEDLSGETRGWLFGTIHALPDGAQWETPLLSRVIDGADLLVVEVRDLDPQRTAATLKRLATDEPGPPLAERLPDHARRELTELLASKGVRPDSFDGLETWAAALAVSRLAGTAPTGNGVDKALIARFADRPISELEGAAVQLGIFDALAERDQRRLLAEVLAEGEDPATDAKALAEHWLAGNLAQLERMTRRGLLGDPALYQALSARRNRAWTAKLAELLAADRRPLVAVGTAHMFGREGLPALLAAKGYRVRRIQ